MLVGGYFAAKVGRRPKLIAVDKIYFTGCRWVVSFRCVNPLCAYVSVGSGLAGRVKDGMGIRVVQLDDRADGDFYSSARAIFHQDKIIVGGVARCCRHGWSFAGGSNPLAH